MRLIPLTDAFRAVVRAGYPLRPAVADEIQSVRYFHSAARCHCRLRRINPEANAADEAMATLKDGIMSGAVRLRAILGDNQPDDIDPMEVAWNGFHVFDNTMEVYGEGGRTLRTYRNVHCYSDEIAALIGASGTTETTPEPDPSGSPPAEAAIERNGSGVRMTTHATAEEACGAWIGSLPKQPRQKRDDVLGIARAKFRALSKKAFYRQWGLHAPAEWRRQGRFD